MSKQWSEIAEKALIKSFRVDEVSKLGISKREYPNGVLNEDCSFTFVGIKDAQAFTASGHSFTIGSDGLAAIQTDENGNLKKMVATAFSTLKKDGKTLLSLSKPADISVVVNNGIVDIMVADETKTTKVNVDL